MTWSEFEFNFIKNAFEQARIMKAYARNFPVHLELTDLCQIFDGLSVSSIKCDLTETMQIFFLSDLFAFYNYSMMSHIWSEICVSGVSAVIQNDVHTSDVCKRFFFFLVFMC